MQNCAFDVVTVAVVVVQSFGASVNAVSADGVSALLLAAHEGYTETVLELLNTGPYRESFCTTRWVAYRYWLQTDSAAWLVYCTRV